ncbi:MAG: hypothetical protein H0X43_14285 [Nitrosospira sp.]|nr:hypothetical protein [Nitrosospira sp.]
MKQKDRTFQNALWLMMMICILFFVSSACQKAGRDIRDSNIQVFSPKGDLIGLKLTSHIAPQIQLEMSDSLKDLVDVPLGDSAIKAAITAAGDYFAGGAKPVAEAVAKGVEAATEKEPDLTKEQKDNCECLKKRSIERSADEREIKWMAPVSIFLFL